MQLLYLSRLASESAISEEYKRNPEFSGYAVQKFNRLVVEGLAKNGHNVIALSTFYMPGFGWYYNRKSEIVEKVKYRYIFSPNNHILRDTWLIFYCFFYVFFWGMRNRKEKAFIADVLNISSCIGAIAAARLLGLRRVGVMTDMPGLMVSRSITGKRINRTSFIARMNKSFLSKFTHYVFLTEQMNAVVNKKGRPYIVMEGLVDTAMVEPDCKKTTGKKVVLYAGGLMERYGLKLLVEGFIDADIENSELWIFGNGPFAEKLEEYHKKYSAVIYKGIRPNEEVVEAEMTATLLVNPRPTEEEFTKYSFPSKNMEYMVSGTPLLTTKLPGMPVEYYNYVYLFEEETIKGYADAIRKTLTRPMDELHAKGMVARKWVLDNKNNMSQTDRIVKLINMH